MLLTPQQHAHLRYLPIDNRFFAGQLPWISLVTRDVIPLAHQGLPIILPMGPEALPQALITPSADDHPFGDHTPRLWQHYPFTLSPPVVGIDTDDSDQLNAVLQIDPEAPHWEGSTGYRLFDTVGRLSPFLRETLSGLRAVQQEVMQMQQLIWRLHGLRVLKPGIVEHVGQCLEVYHLDLEALERQLSDSEEARDIKLLVMASAITASQVDLDVIGRPYLARSRYAI